MAKISKGYGLDDAYKFYKKKNGGGVDRMTYRKICYDLNKMITADVIKGRMVQLPHSMGRLWVKKYEINYDKPPVDYKATKEAGKLIYHLNFHSDGYQCRWVWSKRNRLMKNLIYYSLKMARVNTRALTEIMKQPGGHKRYFT